VNSPMSSSPATPSAPSPPATPAATGAPPPGGPPAAKPAATATRPAPPAKPPRAGEVRVRGVARLDAVHALRWTSHGTVKVIGEVDTGEAALEGQTAVGGTLTADSLRSEGILDVVGVVEVTGRLESNGSLRTRGPVRAASLDLRGTTHLGGDLKVARDLTFRGDLEAPSVAAGSVAGEGAVEVPGEVTAGTVDLRFREKSHIGTIRATTVHLAVRSPNPVERVLGRDLPVLVTRVEADSVELEGVDVRFVRAPRIILGRDAHVTEYEGKIVRRHPSARLGPESRSPPPHGLTR
jgi:cytoskeletal protein CcmA (bactofilin family)